MGPVAPKIWWALVADPADYKKTRNIIWHSPLHFLDRNRNFTEGNDFTCKSPPSVMRMFSAWRWRSVSSKIRAPPKNKMPHHSGKTWQLDGRNIIFCCRNKLLAPPHLNPMIILQKLLFGLTSNEPHFSDPITHTHTHTHNWVFPKCF